MFCVAEIKAPSATSTARSAQDLGSKPYNMAEAFKVKHANPASSKTADFDQSNSMNSPNHVQKKILGSKPQSWHSSETGATAG